MKERVENNNNNNNSCLTQACPFLCGVLSVMMASEQPGSGAAQRRRQRRPSQRVRTTLHEDRRLPGPGCGARDELHGHDPGPSLPLPPPTHTHTLFSLHEEEPGGAAGQAVCRVRTARAGSAAHRGPDRRRRSCVTDARCSCAADGGTAGGCRPVLRHFFACGCRAGY